MGFKQKQWLSEYFFSEQYKHSNIQLNKVWALWKYTELWASSRSNDYQKKFFKILNILNRTIEQICALWKYNVCWASSTSNGFQKKSLKHYTLSNIQLKKECALWKYTEWWASSRSNGFQKKFFKTLYIFKHTIEQSKRSVRVQWVVGFRQKQWVSGEVFQNIFSHSNKQLNKICAMWKYTEWWASSRSNAFRKKFFKTLYTFKHTIEQSMRSVKVHWVVGFKQKQ